MLSLTLSRAIPQPAPGAEAERSSEARSIFPRESHSHHHQQEKESGGRQAGGAGRENRLHLLMAAAVPLLAAPPASAAAGSLYEALRVGRAASPVEIKAAYRAMAKRLHPDASRASGPAAFLEIRRAYETLSDPDARERYDRSLGPSHHRTGPAAGGVRVRRWETDQCW